MGGWKEGDLGTLTKFFREYFDACYDMLSMIIHSFLIPSQFSSNLGTKDASSSRFSTYNSIVRKIRVGFLTFSDLKAFVFAERTWRPLHSNGSSLSIPAYADPEKCDGTSRVGLLHSAITSEIKVWSAFFVFCGTCSLKPASNDSS